MKSNLRTLGASLVIGVAIGAMSCGIVIHNSVAGSSAAAERFLARMDKLEAGRLEFIEAQRVYMGTQRGTPERAKAAERLHLERKAISDLFVEPEPPFPASAFLAVGLVAAPAHALPIAIKALTAQAHAAWRNEN